MARSSGVGRWGVLGRVQRRQLGPLGDPLRPRGLALDRPLNSATAAARTSSWERGAGMAVSASRLTRPGPTCSGSAWHGGRPEIAASSRD
jgi:hypothetical protein